MIIVIFLLLALAPIHLAVIAAIVFSAGYVGFVYSSNLESRQLFQLSIQFIYIKELMFIFEIGKLYFYH